jgi:hypothetical protein
MLPPEEPAVEQTKPETHVATRHIPKPPATSGTLGLVSPFDVLENQIEPGALAFGTLPRYKASNGKIMDNDKQSVGEWLQIEPVSYCYQWMMAPGVNDEEAKEFLKFSYDGEESLKLALEEAVAAGYDNASIKKYIELYGILLGGEKIPDGSSVLGKLVVLSLSPESVKNWNGFKIQSGVQIKMGRMKPEDLQVITAVVEVKTYKNNTFSCFKFE